MGTPPFCLVGTESALFCLLRKKGNVSLPFFEVEDVKWKQACACASRIHRLLKAPVQVPVTDGVNDTQPNARASISGIRKSTIAVYPKYPFTSALYLRSSDYC